MLLLNDILLLAKWNESEMERLTGRFSQIKGAKIFVFSEVSIIYCTLQSEALLCSVHVPEVNEQTNMNIF
jgi:hypothetical protein